MPNLWPAAIAALFLAGCSDDAPKPVKKTSTDRLAKAEVTLSKTPVPRTYTIQGNQLQVLDVPVADSFGFVESHRCFIYRDIEFKTSSISCPQPPEISLNN